MFIDATYEGDLLAAAGVSYHVGREPRSTYDPTRYGLPARFMHASPDIKWTLNYTTRAMTDGPVQMRNGDSNNAGSFSSDCIGRNHRWPDGTYEPVNFSQLPEPRRGLPMPMRELYQIREMVFQDHVSYQLGLMYFLANDPQVPEELQERVKKFGLDPDQFKESGHWPHQLYIREGRRMVSDYVMTQGDCLSKRVAEDSVGLASYAMDSHYCQRVVVVENGKAEVRNEGGFELRCPKPYPISYRSIIPKKTECANLLVPVSLSASHVAFGSIRMEPVFMILGQSAGTAAVMAIERGVPVQDVDYAKLKERLLADGQQL